MAGVHSRFHDGPDEYYDHAIPLETFHATSDDVEPNRLLSEVDEAPFSSISQQQLDSIPRKNDADMRTVDWARAGDMDRKLEDDAKELRGNMHSRKKAFLKKVFFVMQTWIALLMVGTVSGLVAQYVDASTELVSFFKLGVCRPWIWLPKGMCCLEYRGMDKCENWMEWNEVFNVESSTSAYLINYAMFTVIGTASCVFSAWLIREYSKPAAGSGIAEVRTILGGVVMKRYLGGWALLMKSLGVVFSVGSGLSVGKEGPFVHICACIGHLVCRYFPKYRNNEGKKREMVTAACAAGVGVAFGAPIGGLLFAMEMVSTYFTHKTMWRSFFCACIAAVALQLTATGTAGQGKLVIFQVKYHRIWHWFEMIPFMFIGAMGGLGGQLFIVLNMKMAKLKKRIVFFGKYKWADCTVIDAFVWIVLSLLIQFPFEVLREPQIDMLRTLMGECHDLTLAKTELCVKQTDTKYILMTLAASLIKLVLFGITFSVKVPAGNFVPAMFNGALFGRVVGMIMNSWYLHDRSNIFFSECGGDKYCVIPGVYGMIGAACLLGGITRMTVSLAVIMIEVTSGLEYLVPLMIALLFSKLVGDAIDKRNLYDRYIEMNHYPFLDVKRDYKYNGIANDLVAKQTVNAIPAFSFTLAEVEQLLRSTKYTAFPVIASSSNQVPMGIVERAGLISALEQVSQRHDAHMQMHCAFAPLESPEEVFGDRPYIDLSSFVDPNPTCVTDSTNITRVIDLFKALGIRTVLVVREGELVGLVTKKDIVEYIRERPKDTTPHRSNDSGIVRVVRPGEM